MLLLCCSLLSAGHTLRVPILRPSRGGAVSRATVAMGIEGVPREVIEAEAKATAGRPIRLAGTFALGSLSVASAALCVSSLAGQPQAVELAKNLLPFGNVPISLGVNVVLAGTCAWVYQQELETKEKNIQRIWEEVQRRKAAGSKKKRQKKAVAKTPAEMRQQAREKGAAPLEAPPPPPPPLAQPPLAQPTPEPGLFEKIASSSFMEQANTMAKVQAMSLNDALEQRGVLPPIERPREEGLARQDSEQVVEITKSAADTPKDSAPQSSKGKGKKKRKKR